MARETTYYTMSTNVVDGMPRKKCKHCTGLTEPNLMVCRWCGRRFIKRPKATKPKRGSEDRLKLDLAHAEGMAEQWAGKVKRAMDTWHKWNRTARRLSGRIANAPPKPQPARRAIALKELK